MNPFDNPSKDALDSSTDSSSSSRSIDRANSEEVNRLMEELVPREITPKEIPEEEDGTTITTCLTKIDSIRQTIKQIEDANCALKKVIHSYELEQQPEQRASLQRTIASIIQKTNQIAAHSRLSLQTLKLEYNSHVRGNASASVYNLYSQSYAAIAHTFVDSITAYQELQRKYERLLEKNYEQPAFFEETTPPADSPSSGPIHVGATVQHKLVEACMESQLQYREMKRIQESMKEIQQMFLDLALLVDEQDELIDQVQVNIDDTTDRANRTEAELRGAIRRMKRMRKLKCCVVCTIVVLLMMAGLFGMLLVKAALLAVCCSPELHSLLLCRIQPRRIVLSSAPHPMTATTHMRFVLDAPWACRKGNRVKRIHPKSPLLPDLLLVFHCLITMPARDFTKQETILFYSNVVIAVIGVFFTSVFSKTTLNSIASGIVSSIISKSASGIAFFGMFILLLGAHFCRGWDIAYLVIQILILVYIVGASVMCFTVATFIPALSDLSDPDYKEYFVSGSKSILTLIQDNKSLQELYPYLEENLGFCGLYDFTDVLGAGCAYSSQKACTSPKYTFLTLVTSLFTSIFKACGSSFLALLLVEIVFLVMIIIANKSTKNLKSSNRMPLMQSAAQAPAMYQPTPYNAANPAGSTSVQMTRV